MSPYDKRMTRLAYKVETWCRPNNTQVKGSCEFVVPEGFQRKHWTMRAPTTHNTPSLSASSDEIVGSCWIVSKVSFALKSEQKCTKWYIKQADADSAHSKFHPSSLFFFAEFLHFHAVCGGAAWAPCKPFWCGWATGKDDTASWWPRSPWSSGQWQN